MKNCVNDVTVAELETVDFHFCRKYDTDFGREVSILAAIQNEDIRRLHRHRTQDTAMSAAGRREKRYLATISSMWHGLTYVTLDSSLEAAQLNQTLHALTNHRFPSYDEYVAFFETSMANIRQQAHDERWDEVERQMHRLIHVNDIQSDIFAQSLSRRFGFTKQQEQEVLLEVSTYPRRKQRKELRYSPEQFRFRDRQIVDYLHHSKIYAVLIYSVFHHSHLDGQQHSPRVDQVPPTETPRNRSGHS